MNQEWVILGFFDNSMDASLAVSVLARNQVRALLADVHMGQFYPHGVGGIKLLVSPEQALVAAEILA